MAPTIRHIQHEYWRESCIDVPVYGQPARITRSSEPIVLNGEDGKRDFISIPRFPSRRFLQACFYLSLPTFAHSAPSSTFIKRDGSSTKIIVPVVIACALAGLLLLALFTRYGMASRAGHWMSHAATSFGPSTGVTTQNTARELTAQQLVGDAAAAASEQPSTGSAPRARRPRRNRRTPSQISTRSLPVYMKEPGEQEVVIYRGPDDMEDMPTTTNVIMPSVTESGAESPDLSIDLQSGENQMYLATPDSPHDMPLLAGDESLVQSEADITMDNSRTHLMPPLRDVPTRPSVDTLSSEGDSSPLMHAHEDVNSSPDVDLRGEAPPYFEVVALDDLNVSPEPPASYDGHGSPELPPPQRSESTRRRSGFLGLFQSRTSAPARPPVPAEPSGHRRDNSDGSAISVVSNRQRARAQSRATMHRPSFSGSGSMFSVMSRSRSRLLEQQNLTSPSMISVNSISAPLSHTLMRTEFTYPKTGPTPEQLMLISSRESFARFGVPYGQDAIAFAASTSRVELPHMPPPTFDEVMTSSRIDLTTAVAEESAPAEETDAEEEQAEQEADVPSSPASSPDNVPSAPSISSPRSDVPVVSAPIAPPGLGAESIQPESTSPIATPNAKNPSSLPSTLPPRAASRASSYTSFATAEESLNTHATPTPYASVSSRLNLPQVTVSTSSTAEASDDGIATPANLSAPSTPRIPSKQIHDREDTNDTTATLTTDTPVSNTSEVGFAQ